MSKVNTTRVPPVGPKSAGVMLVGEAPGKDEEAGGEPFIGKSGQFLERYMGRTGLRRSQCFLTNLSKHRPKGNRFTHLLDSAELDGGLKELNREIEEVDPHIIVALGNWPMYFLTGCTGKTGKPGTGIMNWRGSIVPGVHNHVPTAEGRKVLITYHPAFVVRPTGFHWHPIFFNDLKRVPAEAKFPDIRYPEYESYIDPPNLREIAAEMMKSEWLTVDIETFGDSLACVGFADSRERGLCITFQNPDGWQIAREMLETEQKKIYQFGTFDINYLNWFYGWEPGGFAFDTYIATANLLPEFPKGLDFLTSIYTPFPYYKEDRKIHKKTGDLTTLWEYNIKDVIATHWIALEQMKELEDLYAPAS